jgi:hypothetical protein
MREMGLQAVQARLYTTALATASSGACRVIFFVCAHVCVGAVV